MTTRRGRPPSKTRGVLYPVPGPFIRDPEPLLRKALRDGVITEYDDGRGLALWFGGPPGEGLRELRRKIQAMRET